MSESSSNIIGLLKKQLLDFKTQASTEEVGTVIEAGDGVVRATGLSNAKSAELLEFQNGTLGWALNLEEDTVGAVILGESEGIKEGDTVKSTGRILSVPVGDQLIGRVVNALGQALDGKGAIQSDKYYPVEKIAPGVMFRKSVDRPVQTGLRAIDAMIPIGRGQRELIIGDRQTGKTAIAVDAIINQKGEDMICIYVAIGQKESKIAKIVTELEKHGSMDYTIIVMAGASHPASLQFLAPYSGCAMAEYFLDKGKDVLIVYDDLSKHANSYRQISLLLKRPPGREAFPGDIFYLHSRLLERACCIDKQFGGGSITALPVIETQAGDLSAYIPTNVISITDGQIFLEADLFYKGIRPAINVGLSVSRVGSAAQIKAMKKIAGKMRLELAQYRELAVFAQFGSDLDAGTKKQLDRGARLTEILKQGQYVTTPVEMQVAIIYAVTTGLTDDVTVDEIQKFMEEMFKYLKTSHSKVMTELKEKKELIPEVESALKHAIEDFKIVNKKS
ncbi:MAG: ATP synthase F1 subunit alpha, F-type H+-transporting ATPase subunit alpha [Candidatus Peregrinibacteria bacterium GW2011_GWC2_39_14]|nr:MAG: ATP synthase subunit alpha [Candidatus Peregrinibacteria bacterium GW2011_GWA2_38_36]KKR04978.1 MAG: ATP synthase F1 subunit alpha, F-type H+-transporting ATPase subunit alpha [Candidatus Peregrinibacteria bacterium GW2011_GWC2_39_14]